MSKKSKPLTAKDIAEYTSAKNAFDASLEVITERIDEIIRVLHVAFNEEIGDSHHWYFEDAKEGEVGTLYLPDHGDDFINYVVPNTNLFGNELNDYSNGFPKKFLFMTDDDIIIYIHKENKKCEANKQRRAEKAAKNKASKMSKKDKILAKLTPEERKALGFSGVLAKQGIEQG